MPTPAALDREIESNTLPNGVRVISEAMPHVRSVSVGIWIATGSRRETGEQNGISHFLEHMVFKGTVNRTAEQIAYSVDSIGGNLDAFTAKEMVGFNTKVLDQHLPLAFDVISDLVLRPLLREEDIEKEKGVILEELKMEADNPEYLVHEIFTGSFWKDHPLGKPILGTKDTIRGFRGEMLRAYHQDVYAPANILITAAGNLDHGKLLELVRGAFEGLAAAGPPPSPVAPKPHARLNLRDKKSLEQVHLCLGVPCLAMAHERRYACYVLNTLLGGSMSSRLFQNIRERRGLVYSVFSELSLFHDAGSLSVCAGTSLEAVRKVIELILEEFRRFKEEPVQQEELRRAKDHLKGSLMLGLESTGSRMANLARQELYFQRFFTMDEMLESIEEVAAGDLQQLAQTFFDPRQVALTVLGSLDGLHVGRDDLRC